MNIDTFVVWVMLCVVGGAGPGWLYARSHTRQGWGLRTSLRLRDSWVLCGVVVLMAIGLWCFFMLQANPGLLWAFPEWVERDYPYFFRSVFLFEAAFLSTAVARVGLLRGGRGAWPIIAVEVLLMGGLCAYLWDIERPIADELFVKRINGVVYQTSGSSCAAASLANVLGQLGIDLTEREAASRLSTTRMGTGAMHILEAARGLGCHAERFRLAEAEWGDAPVPSMIFIDHPAAGREGHAVALIRAGDDRFEVWDPLIGRIAFNHAGLAGVWHGRGIHIWKQKEEP